MGAVTDPILAANPLEVSLQAAAPSPKAFLCLTRCQFTLGSTTPTLSILRAVIALEPKNAPALQLRIKKSLLEGHLTLKAHRRRWSGHTRDSRWISVCRALRARVRRSRPSGGCGVSSSSSHARETSRAQTAANDTPCLNPSPDVLTSRGLVLFLSVRLPQALQHVQSALCVNLGHEPTQRLCKHIKDTERVKEEGNLTGFTATFHPEM
ncbi:hypothetical protein DFH07DRAFT_1010714 [Mycena maculata]|uniref:Uncharacterized protein n=1 Tax=Mycena maculata TaxID=230809 RepID=A0AAD7KBS9_9AGAR|nr:hypothetical protein DFH07DRAFT_1010714 [Mycena maculata]